MSTDRRAKMQLKSVKDRYSSRARRAVSTVFEVAPAQWQAGPNLYRTSGAYQLNKVPKGTACCMLTNVDDSICTIHADTLSQLQLHNCVEQ